MAAMRFFVWSNYSLLISGLREVITEHKWAQLVQVCESEKVPELAPGIADFWVIALTGSSALALAKLRELRSRNQCQRQPLVMVLFEGPIDPDEVCDFMLLDVHVLVGVGADRDTLSLSFEMLRRRQYYLDETITGLPSQILGPNNYFLVHNRHTLGDRAKGFASLTTREREVMKMIAKGGSARAIASDLNLSAKTVEAHKFNLMRKLDLHNQTQLVRYAIQKKVLVSPGVPTELIAKAARGQTSSMEVRPGEDARGFNGLTPRENEIVALVEQELRNKEIGLTLGITSGTVKIHLMHIFEKVGCSDRYELAKLSRARSVAV